MIIYLTPPEYKQTCANEHEYKDKAASYYSGYLRAAYTTPEYFTQYKISKGARY